MASVKTTAKRLYGSKAGKILSVLIIAALVASASASVFVNYYGSAAATARQNDLELIAGTDSATCGTSAPCINVAAPSPYDYATIGMQLGVDSAHSPQPATYFTNATTIQNHGSAARTLESITISGITSTNAADFGNITIFYCATQTNSPSTTSCTGRFGVTSTTGGSVTNLPVTLNPGSANKGYLEIVGYFGAGATLGDTIAFNVQIQWA